MGAKLSEAKWSGADLRRARLIGADLDDFTRAEANCFGAALPTPTDLAGVARFSTNPADVLAAMPSASKSGVDTFLKI